MPLILLLSASTVCVMEPARTDAERLARAARQRRSALGERQVDVAIRGGVSKKTIANLERCQIVDVHNMYPTTVAKIEAGYRWEPGGVAAAIRGDTPRPLPSDGVPSDRQRRHGATQNELARLVEQLPPDVGREIRDGIAGLDDVRRLYGVSHAVLAMQHLLDRITETASDDGEGGGDSVR